MAGEWLEVRIEYNYIGFNFEEVDEPIMMPQDYYDHEYEETVHVCTRCGAGFSSLEDKEIPVYNGWGLFQDGYRCPGCF